MNIIFRIEAELAFLTGPERSEFQTARWQIFVTQYTTLGGSSISGPNDLCKQSTLDHSSLILKIGNSCRKI